MVRPWGGRGTLWGSGRMGEFWEGRVLLGGILRAGGALGRGSGLEDGFLFEGAEGGLGGTVKSCVVCRPGGMGSHRSYWCNGGQGTPVGFHGGR